MNMELTGSPEESSYKNVTPGPNGENYTWKHDTGLGDELGCRYIIPSTENMFKGK